MGDKSCRKIYRYIILRVIRATKQLTYDEGIMAQLEENIKTTKFKTSDDLFNSGDTWEVN